MIVRGSYIPAYYMYHTVIYPLIYMSLFYLLQSIKVVMVAYKPLWDEMLVEKRQLGLGQVPAAQHLQHNVHQALLAA